LFFVNITNNASLVSGVGVQLSIELVQHSRDIKVLEKKITEYLGCGNIYSRDSKSMASINISKFSDILNIMIPFF